MGLEKCMCLYAVRSPSALSLSLMRSMSSADNEVAAILTPTFELQLDDELRPRPDRPGNIPISAVGLTITRGIENTDDHTECVQLNSDSDSMYKALISRRHCVLKTASDGVYIYDGCEDKFSTNGTSVNHVLVPLGGSMHVPVGARVQFGVPHLAHQHRQIKPEFVYWLRHVDDSASVKEQIQLAPPPPTPIQADVEKEENDDALQYALKRTVVTRSMTINDIRENEPVAKRTRSSFM